MKETYTTSEIAKIIGIHPNTVRLYEDLELISPPKRKANGYRIFTNLHVEQFRIARLAFQIEVLQNGLRKKATEIVKTCAKQDFDTALSLTCNYMEQLKAEKRNAEEAVLIVEQLLAGSEAVGVNCCFTRKQAADHLNISMDTLRNWELNGLLTVKRMKNGYRVYTAPDLKRLKIIRSLRCANYSLTAILRMLRILSSDPDASIRTAIDAPEGNTDILTACDNLLTSLTHAGANAQRIKKHLVRIKRNFS